MTEKISPKLDIAFKKIFGVEDQVSDFYEVTLSFYNFNFDMSLI
jgi:hypothetical protein